jgi:PPK2 family polyphosphate:nucleotide phosphotransferase
MKSSIVTVKPNQKIRLRDIDASATGSWKTKEESSAALEKLHKRLFELQEALYAEHRRSLLIVFQAMDTGGKDGALKSLLSGINPAGVRVTSFKAPTSEELSHDFLWRIHQHAPPYGYIGVWNRSHYEDVLVTRVHKLITKKTWEARYEAINNFEKHLSDNNTTILKFHLYISKEEQKERLQARLDNPDKHWKFSTGDLAERKFWDDYQRAYEDAINATSTTHAPWHIVPANKKWARNIALAETVVEALEKMNPKYPKVNFDPTSIVIE